ncbi:GTP-binding protein At3g49725, chloroplastic isoform X1 [Magnolia sinica]|uniref:GTP-binding protein At3g49725, chloroplastic isoform X1 n=1 Tax=Magnolia sinica TaxID=86752 RepID=UPI00265893B9|nr:GTP-binding protein At3g49725, chloroplastic isoform X1 [Magnolia sinica]
MFRTIFLLKTPLRSLYQTPLFFPSALSPSFQTNTPSLLKIPPNPFFTTPSNNTFPPNSILCSPFSSQSSRQKKADEDYEDDGGGEFIVNRDPKSPPKLFIIQPRLRPDTLLQAKLDEALNLANSLEERRDGDECGEFGEREMPPHLIVQNPAARSPKAHADTYFGQGTVENVKCHLNALESGDKLDAVFVNTILSGIQQRNLEATWGMPVLDRVGLIIEIFNAHAQTKEAKLQSELAALMYKRTRLVRLRGPDGSLTFGAAGEAEVVSARGRGSGGRGFISGAGETELQLQRRRILERRNHLLSQIEDVRRTRALQRYARRRRGGSQGQGLATVAVVGYTNAGKSTLVSALSDSDLYSDDRLFATVDPRLRSVILPSGRKVLLSDTVGFISDLPVQLVEAFHATLEEVVEADLLVHVLDSSAFNVDEQRSTVLQVLQQIGVSEEKLQNMIEVWNKIDLLETETVANKSLDQGDDDEGSGFSEAEEHDMASELSPREIDEDDIASELLPVIEAVDDDQNRSSEDVMMNGEDTPTQPQDVQCIKTSATMGVGLQELLSLIDGKLNTRKSMENSFDRKWRPPSADGDTAVEQ